jgi:GNAT superfamily N-acetyltransferase
VTRYDVRALRVEDAEALGRVHITVWRQAYADLVPADFLAGLSAQRSAQNWARAAAEPAPGCVQLVGTADGELVGFAVAGPSRDLPPDPPYELWVVNVLAEHHGTGLATRLLDESLAAVADGAAASLWVLRGNARACAFYTRHGFAPDGTTKQHPGTGAIEERWVRPPTGNR